MCASGEDLPPQAYPLLQIPSLFLVWFLPPFLVEGRHDALKQVGIWSRGHVPLPLLPTPKGLC